VKKEGFKPGMKEPAVMDDASDSTDSPDCFGPSDTSEHILFYFFLSHFFSVWFRAA